MCKFSLSVLTDDRSHLASHSRFFLLLLFQQNNCLFCKLLLLQSPLNVATLLLRSTDVFHQNVMQNNYLQPNVCRAHTIFLYNQDLLMLYLKFVKIKGVTVLLILQKSTYILNFRKVYELL